MVQIVTQIVETQTVETQSFLQAHNDDTVTARQLMGHSYKTDFQVLNECLATAQQVHDDCIKTPCSRGTTLIKFEHPPNKLLILSTNDDPFASG